MADVILFVSGKMITFSQGGEAKIKFKQFSKFGSQTKKPPYIRNMSGLSYKTIDKTICYCSKAILAVPEEVVFYMWEPTVIEWEKMALLFSHIRSKLFQFMILNLTG